MMKATTASRSTEGNGSSSETPELGTHAAETSERGEKGGVNWIALGWRKGTDRISLKPTAT